MPFLSKKKSVSLTLSGSSVSTSGLASSTQAKKTFAKFDEKKDYVRRCNMKHPPDKKAAPCVVSFCLGKKL